MDILSSLRLFACWFSPCSPDDDAADSLSLCSQRWVRSRRWCRRCLGTLVLASVLVPLVRRLVTAVVLVGLGAAVVAALVLAAALGLPAAAVSALAPVTLVATAFVAIGALVTLGLVAIPAHACNRELTSATHVLSCP